MHRRTAYRSAVPLPVIPKVERLLLATIRSVPAWHPEHASFEPFPVHAWVVRHPDGLILVDSGVGLDEPVIEEWYSPEVTPLDAALHEVGVGVGDIHAVILSHLHFDHCGQQGSLDASVYVQRAELEAAAEPGYTVPQWGAVPAQRLRTVDGDSEIADGVRLLATPGHTPGHQSVVISAGEERIVLAGQCAFSALELASGEPHLANVHDETWVAPARESLRRVHDLAPVTCHLSHDHEVVRLDR